MINEQALKQFLVKIVYHIKENYDYSVTVANEVAALRQCLTDAGGEKFRTLFETRLNEVAGAVAALKAASLADLDALIRQLMDGTAF